MAKSKYDRKDLVDIRKLLKVSKAYKKAKPLFRKASQSKKKADWLVAYDAYEEYNKIYDHDIDALLEFGEICIHIGALDEALTHFTDSSDYQKKNPFHLVRIGEVYARKRSYKEMQGKFWELFQQDNTNKTYLRNYAIACVKARDTDKIKDLIATHREKLQENILPTRDKTKEPKNLFDTLNDSLRRLQKDPNEPHHDLDKEIIYRKGKGGENTFLNQEQRLGVLLLLWLFPGATKERIRDEWLKNANTTTDILDEFIARKEIKKVQLPPVEMYYVTELGVVTWEVEETLKLIKKLYEKKQQVIAKKKEGDIIPFGPIFTDRLVDQVVQWDWFKTHGKVVSDNSRYRKIADKTFSEDLGTE